VNRISDNVNNGNSSDALMSEANLNTVLKEIGSQSLEELLEETMSKNDHSEYNDKRIKKNC
jgi:hypothetical protein